MFGENVTTHADLVFVIVFKTYAVTREKFFSLLLERPRQTSGGSVALHEGGAQRRMRCLRL